MLAYKVRRDWVDVRSDDLNATVRELAGERYTCNDLRTWNATVLAAVTLAGLAAQDGVPTSQRARKRMTNAAVSRWPGTWATPRPWPARLRRSPRD